MMEQSGYYRKYIILGELDPGFGIQYPPDGFVRIEGNRDGITLSLQIRNLREGAEPYTVILVYNKNNNIGILRAGTPEFFTKTCVLRKKLDYDAVDAIGMSPENMQYVLIASEHPGRVNIPLVGLCNKSMPWDESIRQRLLRSEKQQEPIDQGWGRARPQGVLHGADWDNTHSSVQPIGMEKAPENVQPVVRDTALENVQPEGRDNVLGTVQPEGELGTVQREGRVKPSGTVQFVGKDTPENVQPVVRDNAPVNVQPEGGDNVLGTVQPEGEFGTVQREGRVKPYGTVQSVGKGHTPENVQPVSTDNDTEAVHAGNRDFYAGLQQYRSRENSSEVRSASNRQADSQVAGRAGRSNFPRYRLPESKRYGSERRPLTDRNTARETNRNEKPTTVDEKRSAYMEEEKADKTMGKPANKVDDVRLERKLKDSFEVIEPFSNPRHDYSWYKVNDLAKLSNLLFACNLRIPLFANPKILVGLFKYRHLLAGFYRSDRNDMDYFVLGVPSKDDSEGKPFEDISLWVETVNPEFGDMTGYWLVYINLRSGDFVQ